MNIRYRVDLSEAERAELTALLSGGKYAAGKSSEHRSFWPPTLADPKRPVVYFDESPTQLVVEPREPIPAEPGQPERHDYEHHS
jgi:hypothetical protein